MSAATWRIRRGNVLDALDAMPADSVQCVVTSPPYWGLRDYGLPPTVWGGDPSCDHDWSDLGRRDTRGGSGGDHSLLGEKTRDAQERARVASAGSTCARCGAWLGGLGLEPSFDDFLDHFSLVFEKVKRVLRKDGTLWLNMGDCYVGSPARGAFGDQGNVDAGRFGGDRIKRVAGLKPKQRLLQPARCAIRLQEDGWWVRSEIVWSKPNPLPSSVPDRPSDSHEMIYLLTKSPRYFYDRDGVREVAKFGFREWGDGVAWEGAGSDDKAPQRTKRTVRGGDGSGGRNLRTVWTIPTQAWRGNVEHFATFPERLARQCIRAGTSPRGACTVCGAPWKRLVRAKGGTTGRSWHDHSEDAKRGNVKNDALGGDGFAEEYRRETIGWAPSCAHADAPTRPCLVLDPFSGTGTTGAVATEDGCSYEGIELSEVSAAASEVRISAAAPPLFSAQRERAPAEALA